MKYFFYLEDSKITFRANQFACESGNLEIVNFLMENGASDFNCLDSACISGNLELVKMLLSKGFFFNLFFYLIFFF